MNLINFTKNILISSCLILGISNCKIPESYQKAIQAQMRLIEREDHQACVSQGIDFEDWDSISTEIYWRCRYSFIEKRRIHHAITAADIENNSMIKKISEKILNNLHRSKQAILSKIENNVEVFDHSKCLSMGYSLEEGDQVNDIQYYKCRENLIKSRTAPPPDLTNSFESSMMPKKKFEQYLDSTKQNKVISEDVKFTRNMIDRYPVCREVNVKSKFFGQCIKSQEESLVCFSNINTLAAKKKLDDKVYCQQQSFAQFPDNYSLTRNKSASEIEKMIKEEREKEVQRLKDLRERNINKTLKFFQEGYVSKDKLFRDDEIIDKKQEQSKKEEINDKIKILSLREEFINKCNELMHSKIPDYIKEQENKCKRISEDWQLSD
jgi:hypothetical protein